MESKKPPEDQNAILAAEALQASDNLAKLAALMGEYSLDEKPAVKEFKQNKKRIDYYLLQDGEVETVDKYTMFSEWCQKEGMIMPKLEYPAYFENGLEGTRCKEDIEHREAFLFVPYKMMISVKDTHSHKVL